MMSTPATGQHDQVGPTPTGLAPSKLRDSLAALLPNGTRQFVAALLLLVVVAFGVRTAFVLGVSRYDKHFYDAVFYQLEAQQVATGHGFTDPFQALTQPNAPPLPTAVHPPLTVLVLTPVAWATGGSALAERFTMVVLGSATVLLVGLLGREVAGNRVGLLAAAIAAVYPNLWVNDGLIMSETLTALTVVTAMLLAYRLTRRPRVATALGLGVVCGFATLARAELVLLAPLLAVWFVLPKQRASMRRRSAQAGAILVAAGLVMAPWLAYNLSRFQTTTFISTNDGATLLASNCDAAYHGYGLGLVVDAPGVCLPRTPPRGDESTVSRIYRAEGIHYMKGHLQRLTVVTAARIGRDWSLFRPLDMLQWNENEGRPQWVTGLGLGFFYPLLALAAGGVVILWRRRAGVWPLVVPAVIVTVSTFASYGQTRLRVEAEPSLTVLAAVALVAAYTRWRGRERPSATGDAQLPTLDPG
jgi:4-amino-4-deoxy-L-arabinose transferase-like glycosyltransferase